MKKLYEKLSITPLQVYAGCSLLQGSVVQTGAAVRTTGQVVNEIDFENDPSFQQDWE